MVGGEASCKRKIVGEREWGEHSLQIIQYTGCKCGQDGFDRTATRFSPGKKGFQVFLRRWEGVRVELARLVPGEGKRKREKALTGPVSPGCKVEEWSDDGVRPTPGIVIAVRSLGTYSNRKYASKFTTVALARLTHTHT